jgi:hypothetical protein
MEDMPQTPTRTTALQGGGLRAARRRAGAARRGAGARERARQVMLLAEATQAAGAAGTEATALPGLQLGAVEEKRAVIVRANQEREKFHRGCAAAPPTA